MARTTEEALAETLGLTETDEMRRYRRSLMTQRPHRRSSGSAQLPSGLADYYDAGIRAVEACGGEQATGLRAQIALQLLVAALYRDLTPRWPDCQLDRHSSLADAITYAEQAGLADLAVRITELLPE